MTMDIYAYARARGVELKPTEVEGFVNGLPDHERQNALILVLASDTPKTPGHVFPQWQTDFIQEANATPKAPAPKDTPAERAALPKQVRVRDFDMHLSDMQLGDIESAWTRNFEFGTLWLRMQPPRMTLVFASGSMLTGTGDSPAAAYTDLVGAVHDHFTDVAMAVDALP